MSDSDERTPAGRGPKAKQHDEIEPLYTELVEAIRELGEADLALTEARRQLADPEARRRAAAERLERARLALDIAAGLPLKGGQPVEPRKAHR